METYKKAGVDIDEMNRAVAALKRYARRGVGKKVLSSIGSFGGMFPADMLKKYRQPILVSSVDGVGTKLMVAILCNRHDTVGMDLTAHCANDIVAQGARPLFFLDYVAMGKLRSRQVTDIVKGLVKGCNAVGMKLVGGETAEMPGLYKPEEYDLVGTIVGVVEKGKVIDGKCAKAGDVLIGLPSNGLHTNGYSLARKILFNRKNYTVRTRLPEFTGTLGQELLKPHRPYVKEVLALAAKVKVKGVAHITGGGFYDNLPRVVPDKLKCVIDKKSWRVPAIFRVIAREGELPDSELYRVFNMGMGMVVVVDKKDEKKALRALGRGIAARVIGRVEKRGKREDAVVILDR